MVLDEGSLLNAADIARLRAKGAGAATAGP
jgi:hypothetical protein